MMKLDLDSNLRAPSLPPEHRLHRILDSALEQRVSRRAPATERGYYWGAERYGLDRCRLFGELGPERREAVLRKLSHLNLSLSCYIERSGLNFGAKMILLSDSLEEKSLYSLFVSEETTHRALLEPFLCEALPADPGFHPLLKPLSEIITQGERDALVFIVQVLLEGFGIAHYHGLKETSLDPALEAALATILKDEARHHGSGLVSWSEIDCGAEARDQIFEMSRHFVDALLNAHWIARAVEEECGGLTREQRLELLDEIGWESQATGRMTRLKMLLRNADRIGLVERLERDGAFSVAGALK